MSIKGKVDYSELTDFIKKLGGLKKRDISESFIQECSKELAARLLRKVIKRTPVGDYSSIINVTAKRDGKKHKKGEVYQKRVNISGKMGGNLRRGWTADAKQDVESYVNSLPVMQVGKTYLIEIINHVTYSSYVEYGHRQTPGRYVPAIGKRLKAGWVEGKFMLTISEREIQELAPRLLQRKLAKHLEDYFGDTLK